MTTGILSNQGCVASLLTKVYQIMKYEKDYYAGPLRFDNYLQAAVNRKS